MTTHTAIRKFLILALLVATAIAGCRSHKESDIRVAETTQTQTVEQVQTRTDSRAEARLAQSETADSIAWTATADSVVQTEADGTRRVLHRVRWMRTAYRPTASAKASATMQHTDTTSAALTDETHIQTAAHAHSESSRGGRPWWPWIALATSLGILAYNIYSYHHRKE